MNCNGPRNFAQCVSEATAMVQVVAEGAKCDDGSVCTGPQDQCNAKGQCTGPEIPCTPPNKCKVNAGCDPIAGCKYDDVVCNSPSPCEVEGTGVCQEVDGTCTYTVRSCPSPSCRTLDISRGLPQCVM